jgi:molybdenum cofactor cytidylyltransferase
MQQLTLSVSDAVGLTSRHNISDAHGRKIVAKGRVLTQADITLLASHGIDRVTVVRLAADDIDEHVAASRVAHRVTGDHTQAKPPHHGRADVEATVDGVLLVEIAALARWHQIDGVTIATRRTYDVVRPGQRVATIKILPFAIRAQLLAIESIPPVLSIKPFVRTRIGVVLIGAPATYERLTRSHVQSLVTRLTVVKAQVVAVQQALSEVDAVRHAFDVLLPMVDLIITLGETSIMDRDDVMPQALVATGGRITCYGAPVEPGNLLLLGMIGTTPVMGAPGCIRGSATNVVDLVLPRLVAGIDVDAHDVYALAHGGLLEEDA